MRRLALALVLLTGCDRPTTVAKQPTGGAALEQAARERGLVAAATAPSGVFQTDTDRVCLLPAPEGVTIGASVDYGEGQRCVARGRAVLQSAQTLKVDFGGDCRFDARLEAERLVFPPVLPEACAVACAGRASLSAITAARLSDASAEAARTRGADGSLLCPG
jgi:hypothetical protein